MTIGDVLHDAADQIREYQRQRFATPDAASAVGRIVESCLTVMDATREILNVSPPSGVSDQQWSVAKLNTTLHLMGTVAHTLLLLHGALAEMRAVLGAPLDSDNRDDIYRAAKALTGAPPTP
jgi:hypothetical protein